MAMTLRLTDEQDRALSLLARTQNCSKQEAATRAILAAATRMLDNAHVAHLARQSLREYLDAERRLHP
ncbi:CopG family transcriptional regulator [Corynebacterium sp. 21KM1197]|uniref:CopG family transcriptional regulator n=1 Tax=Corynebacterium sp. 21KM1197 TaxID=2989734 RepID=UPI0029CA55AF|nr:CopG family transcriptional regulator [Corynebacterium sp. 21KM1197]WPF68662.1 CopG family transcriptional regulator [Corynebacterium sp. 21KM1197]